MEKNRLLDEIELQGIFEYSIDQNEPRTLVAAITLSGTIRGVNVSCGDFRDCHFEDVKWVDCDLRGTSIDSSNTIEGTMNFERCQTRELECPEDC